MDPKGVCFVAPEGITVFPVIMCIEDLVSPKYTRLLILGSNLRKLKLKALEIFYSK